MEKKFIVCDWCNKDIVLDSEHVKSRERFSKTEMDFHKNCLEEKRKQADMVEVFEYRLPWWIKILDYFEWELSLLITILIFALFYRIVALLI